MTAAEAAIRAKREAKVFELGIPACPQQYAYNDKALWTLWRQCASSLYHKRLLAYSDGQALLDFCKAAKNGQSTIQQQVFDATWRNRKPFPEPTEDGGKTLAGFIEQVKTERSSFAARLQPAQTITLDSAAEYLWPDGDASTIARQYAQNVVAGSIPAGELIVRAARRFLDDLEQGYKRGIFWDPFAARNIVHFVEQFCELKLLPWQVWVLASIFAFKRASGHRRFQEAWLSMGRKNGKTRLASAVALYLLLADDEKYAEVYAAATAREQSRIVWRDARRSVGDSAELLAHVKRWAGELHVPETDSRFLPLASEDKSFLGVRAHGVIADEVGVWSDRNAWDALVQSTVSRVQPLTLAITTAPAHKMTFAAEKFAYVEKVLRGIVQADYVFGAIYTLDAEDTPTDMGALRKANPSLGVLLLEEHLAKQIEELKDSPSGLNNFLQFHANVTPEKTLTQQGSISARKWDECAHRELMPDCKTPMEATLRFLEMNRDTQMFVGVDIGLVNDLTAIALLFPRGRFTSGGPLEDKKVVIVQAYAPEAGILDKERQWQVPLSQWVRSQWLDLLPGDMVDVRRIVQAIEDIDSKLTIREVGFDPWQFSTQAAQLIEHRVNCVAVPQTAKDLTPACRDFLAAVHNGDVVHFGNPLLAWMACNVVLQESEKHSGIKPDKLEQSAKIDGIAATINAWQRMLANPVVDSVYDKRGILFI